MLHHDWQSFHRVARVLACTLLCALALVAIRGAQPESAHAATVTKGWVTGTVYFNKKETRTISEFQIATMACVAAVPAWLKPVCAYAVVWTTQARRARDRGMCLKVKFLLANPVDHWPDIYGGGYCR
ncbi:MAG: hypothetical protein QOK16_2339 [Solirubrobacteraceae bacterium]|jgi:hypothetical protein|nr:hypothetical protein [Solirubrobacteraceae bacterium]MEA2184069.1 hypothetical protein [Solirubrobacteraceae bacterium]MEA2187328.1 hypothetical protein [Solirubrobacteraceae bacterium]